MPFCEKIYYLDKLIAMTYHLFQGPNLHGVMSTGEMVWELVVTGQLFDNKWTAVALRWKKPDLTDTMTPVSRLGGLGMRNYLLKISSLDGALLEQNIFYLAQFRCSQNCLTISKLRSVNKSRVFLLIRHFNPIRHFTIPLKRG